MSASVSEVIRAVALIALVVSFGYGFMVRVTRWSTAAAIVSTLAYGFIVAPDMLGHYRFPHAGVLAAVVVGALAALAALVWVFRRWPLAAAPVLAALAAFRVPIPVSRSGGGGAAPEYLFLLVPLYGAIVAALLAEALGGDEAAEPLWRRDPLRLPVGALLAWAALATLWTQGQVQGAVRLFSFWLLLPAGYHVLWRALRLEAPGSEPSRAELVPEAEPGSAELSPEAEPGRAVLPRAWWWTVQTLVGLGTALAVLGIDQHFRRWLLFRNTNVESSQWQQVIFRVNAVFWDPNVFARFLILTGLLAGAAWFGLKGRARWLGLGMAPMVMAFYFTYSRSGWLVAVFAVALVVWLRLGWKRAMVAVLALSLVLGATMLVIRAPRYRRTTVQLFEATLGIVKNGRLELATPINKLTGGRYGLIVGGMDMFAARPIAGWGLGAFPSVYERYRPPDAPPALRESHNSPVTIAAETGIVGLALLVWSIVAVIRLLWVALKDSTGPRHVVAAAVAGGLFAIFMHSLLYAALIEDPFTWVLLALIPVGVTAAGSAASTRVDTADG